MSHSSSSWSPNAMYGLPALSSVMSANSVEASWPKPPSKTSCGVQVCPPSSDQAIQTVWNVSICVSLQPVAALVIGSAASHAAYTRPACGPDCTMRTPPGMLLQKVSASASADEAETATGRPKVLPPSVDFVIHTWLGRKSWYSMYTIPSFV